MATISSKLTFSTINASRLFNDIFVDLERKFADLNSGIGTVVTNLNQPIRVQNITRNQLSQLPGISAIDSTINEITRNLNSFLIENRQLFTDFFSSRDTTTSESFGDVIDQAGGFFRALAATQLAIEPNDIVRVTEANQQLREDLDATAKDIYLINNIH